jgi:NlpC/P60 family putative phage cell wall peptidase
MPARADVIAAARAWHGTPFRHQGRIKGKAIDCVGLVLCVAEELGILDVDGRAILGRDYLNYRAQPLDSFVHQECERRLIQWDLEAMAPGDVVTMRVPDVPCHVAIISELQGNFGLIHAYSSIGKVAEHILDEKWRRRICGVFTFPGVE